LLNANREPRQAAHLHADREVLALNVAFAVFRPTHLSGTTQGIESREGLKLLVVLGDIELASDGGGNDCGAVLAKEGDGQLNSVAGSSRC
jgi:hypothetical protein